MKASRFVWVAAVVIWGALAGRATAAEEFGDISGELIAEGFVPIPQPYVQDVGPSHVVIPNESYVVDRKTGGVANVFVYLRKAPDAIAPELKESKPLEVQVTIENYRYVPHALIVRTGQKLRFTSTDAVKHNIFTHTLANPQKNFLIEPLDKTGVAIELKASEPIPVPINGCLYPAMRAMLLVVDHPYAAITDKEGRFTIKGLPAGEHSFRAWHETAGYLEREWKVNVVAGKTTAVPPVTIPAAKLLGEDASQVAAEAEFGNITGEFITEGFVPIQPPVFKDAGPPPIVVPNESYVVDKKTGGVANVFIYLRKAPATRPPELDKSVDPEVTITLQDRQFAPHAVVVRTDQKLRFVNIWPRAYQIHTYTVNTPPQNVAVLPADKKGVTIAFQAPEPLPMPITDDFHPWMRMTTLVVDHPYAAVTDKEGRFTIQGLPAGEHSFRVWHERRGYLEREWKVTVVGGETSQLEPYVIPISKLTEPRN